MFPKLRLSEEIETLLDLLVSSESVYPHMIALARQSRDAGQIAPDMGGRTAYEGGSRGTLSGPARGLSPLAGMHSEEHTYRNDRPS